MDKLVHRVGVKEGSGVLDDFVLWFVGYTYKYWMRTRKMKPKEVYNMLPLQESFAFYHTQGFEYVVQDAIDKYERMRDVKKV